MTPTYRKLRRAMPASGSTALLVRACAKTSLRRSLPRYRLTSRSWSWQPSRVRQEALAQLMFCQLVLEPTISGLDIFGDVTWPRAIYLVIQAAPSIYHRQRQKYSGFPSSELRKGQSNKLPPRERCKIQMFRSVFCPWVSQYSLQC
jgi:hypothetical protein